MFRHIVLIRLRYGDEEGAEHVIKWLKQLAEDQPDIHQWEIHLSQDQRKGLIVVENGLFTSKEAFEKWKATREHSEFADYLSARADWTIGDYDE